MPRTRKTLRQVRRVRGVIDPNCDYSTKGCMNICGLGPASLSEGRQMGILHPYEKGRQLWYSGIELQQYIRTGRRL